jgi:hypothetical protein
MARTSRYCQEVRERAVRMVFEHGNEYDSEWEALFEAVVSETLEAHGRRLDALASEIADVAEFCAAAMRLTVRMVEARPAKPGTAGSISGSTA